MICRPFHSSRMLPWTIMSLALPLFVPPCPASASESQPNLNPTFGTVWFDGQAEISTYTYQVERYGETREGNAVAIFVTEDFNPITGVKSDTPPTLANGIIPVLKLNLIRDFPTGIYDYNTMLSTFVSTQPKGERKSGSLIKASFSSQEWCGHVYHQIIPRARNLESTSHSYFEGEADQKHQVSIPNESTYADALFHWARGFSSPIVPPGTKQNGKVFQSLMDARLGHFDPQFLSATFSVSNKEEIIRTEGSSWTTTQREVRLSDGRTYSFWVELQSPFKIIKWSFKDGGGLSEEAVLHRSKRVPYWKMNGSKGLEHLAEIGLKPRPRMSP
jgi:hypothetical protein